MKEAIQHLMNQFREISIIKGSNQLLKPRDAIRFAEGLKPIGIGIGSVELWYYKDFNGRQAIVEDPYGPDFYDLLEEENGVQKSIEATKHYIIHDLPERIAFVSFVLHTDEPYWEILKQEPQVLSETP